MLTRDEKTGKIRYQQPAMQLAMIKMEDPLCAASATLQSGGPNGGQPWNPQMEDWTEVGTEDKTFDL